MEILAVQSIQPLITLRKCDRVTIEERPWERLQLKLEIGTIITQNQTLRVVLSVGGPENGDCPDQI
jgi:hypothetical protein